MKRFAVLAAIVGLVGIGWSSYVLSESAQTFCVLGSQCQLVYQTSYSHLFGIPIATFAVGWFLLLTIIASASAYGVRAASQIGLVVGALSVPTVIWLDYVQLGVIHLICSNCVLAHAIGLVLFALFILTYRSDRKEQRASSEKPSITKSSR